MWAMRTGVLALLAWLIYLPTPTPAQNEDPIQAAIKRGAAYLQRVHAQGGGAGGESFGAAGLSGMAMLEAGVATTDPAIQSIAKTIRAGWATNTKTYDVSLAILFLDRLGNVEDKVIIQLLGTRLYAGLSREGWYSYTCTDVVPLTQAALSTTRELVGGTGNAKPPAKKDDGFPVADPNKPAEAKDDGTMLPGPAAYNRAVRKVLATNGRQFNGGGDNSNTQFGLIGLWVAARHGVPCDDAFQLLEARFIRSQNPADAGWGYSQQMSSTTAMTCAGILSVAIGTSRNKAQPAPKPAESGDSNDPFNRAEKPKDKGGAPAGGGANPFLPALTPQGRKTSMDSALKSVGGVMKAVKTKRIEWTQFIGFGDVYYTLWSIERVGMALGLKTIGDVDWHALGCEYLIPIQAQDGSWPRGTHGEGEVSTAFAVLFLSKSNFVKDLTKRLTGEVKDPGNQELRAGKDFKPPLFAPPEKQPEPGSRPDAGPAPTTADAVANDLVNSPDFEGKLKIALETKGTEYTNGLVRAIPRLQEPKLTQARDALAERLTRMTAKTLRTMLKESESELRRAAALACGMKDDKSHIPDLIDRITDPAETVVQASRAALKSLTTKDLGPKPGADEEAKKRAAADWNKWYLSEAKPN
ncbi:MAG: HEAT repeat domain-containing protein [Fimbriiglobus sp.]